MSERIQQDLASIGPDLTNVTRLFGLPDAAWDGSGPFSYTMEETETGFRCRFRSGEACVERTAVLPAPTPDDRVNALHRRRVCRRLCRQTLYDLCRMLTGQHPAWGSLTGIRATICRAPRHMSRTSCPERACCAAPP